MTELVGQTIGQYQVIELISLGENVVYKGFEPAANRYVAVKTLDPTRAIDPAFIRQFQQDMEILAGLQHPNLLPIYDYGQYKGWLYIITPFIEGGTLKQRLKQFYSLPPAQALVNGIAGALDYLHSQGLVHGNLKPANVLLNPRGEPFLTDFGYTQGIDIGIQEPAYLSPELASGVILDQRADTYALGVLLYEMLIGEPPQPGVVPNPRLKRPDLPPAVEKVILKAMAQDPAQRFQTAGELNRALQLAVPGPAIYAAPSPPPEVEPETPRRDNRPLWIIGGVAALLALVACAIFFLGFGGFGGGGGSNPTAVVPTPPPAVPVVIARGDVNIRSGPGEVYDIIGLLKQGQSAEAIARSPDQRWWAIKVAAAASSQGWVSGDLVEAQGTDNVPILEPPPTPTPVQGEPQPPQAAIDGPTSAQVGQQVSFTARNSTVAEGSHLVTFAWDFGDGATADGVDVAHVYNEPGSYQVALTVTDDKGLNHTATHQISIDPVETPEPEEPPVAVITAPSEAQVGETVTFDAQSSQSANPIVSYAWDLGDGTTANAVQINHVYGTPAVYNVILTVTDDKGLSGTSNVQINVVAPPAEVTEEPPAGGDLENVEWVLNGTLPGTEITALFQNGTVSGSAGCNTYSSSYQLDGTNISITPPPPSQEICEEEIMAQERRYFDALIAAQSFEIQRRGQLRITGGETMTFSAR